MLGSFLSRTLLLIFGYAYPGYECFKIVENNRNNKAEIEILLTWCQYWILVATLTVFERIGDVFFSWLPLYSEAKLGFLIYLWSSNMKGTKYVYKSFFKPFMARHEEEIDENISKIRSKAGSFLIVYWKKALIIGQTKFFEILQNVYSSESLLSRPTHHDQRRTTMDSWQSSDDEEREKEVNEDTKSKHN